MIRQASKEDIPRLLEIGESLHSQTSFAVMSYNKDKAKAMLEALIDNDQFFMVAEVRGELVGAMAGYVSQPWYSDDFIAHDMTLYILPEHKGSILAVKLIEKFTQWALSRAVKQIRPGVETGCVGEAADKLYRLLGYQYVGGNYLLEK